MYIKCLSYNKERNVDAFKRIYLHMVSYNNRRASSGGGGGVVQGVRTPALCRYSPNCALKFLNQFRRNALKNQFKKRKNPSKRCTNSILFKFFNATLTIAGQKNEELIYKKLRLIRKLKFSIFNSMTAFSIFHSTCYPIFGSFTIFNSTSFENLKPILLLNLLI